MNVIEKGRLQGKACWTCEVSSLAVERNLKSWIHVTGGDRQRIIDFFQVSMADTALGQLDMPEKAAKLAGRPIRALGGGGGDIPSREQLFSVKGGLTHGQSLGLPKKGGKANCPALLSRQLGHETRRCAK